MIDREKYQINYGEIVSHFMEFAAAQMEIHHSEIWMKEGARVHIENMINKANRKIDSLLCIIEFLEDKLDEYMCDRCERD